MRSLHDNCWMAPALAKIDGPSAPEPDVRREPRRMPRTVGILVGLGLLLFGGLLVVLLNGGESGSNRDTDAPAADSGASSVQEPTPWARSDVADLPAPVRLDEFPGANEPPRVLDGAYPSDRARLDQGRWLLLILDPRSPEGEQTFVTAHALHRRLAPHGVNVTVVLPRLPYEDETGRLAGDAALDAQLRADGRNWLWDGIHVVLDPLSVSGSGRGVLATKYSFEEESVAAMLLSDGKIESRTAPPEGGFTELSLVHPALRALELEREAQAVPEPEPR